MHQLAGILLQVQPLDADALEAAPLAATGGEAAVSGLVMDGTVVGGLDEGAVVRERAAAEADGKDGWKFTLQMPSYLPVLQYADDRELIMDIMKYGPDVQVLAPESLRATVAAKLQAAARLYD